MESSVSDADLFGQRSKSTRNMCAEASQLNLEFAAIKKMLAGLCEEPTWAMRQLKMMAEREEGVGFHHFHSLFSFPMALAGCKVRKAPFIPMLSKLSKTPAWKEWKRHLETYEGSQYYGMVYNSIGDTLPTLLMHNCEPLPVFAPYWRCRKPTGGDDEVFFTPLACAVEGFHMLGWLLEG